ncbi:hypothetical protein [Geopsychrobacter electrodiphilus]|uniref:hypothetical protein n=1 Tax=Geopsychrobacter electrodiphilus TaxID=225196 RepID=UPI00036FC130|nr:hypothetical protein [Geopsychrobacter electrodiphilus]
MKKILIITIFAVFMTSSAFAATNAITFPTTFDKANTGKTVYGDSTDASATNVNAALIGKTSSGVGCSIKSTTLGYAAVTQHLNGTKAFASSNDSTSIYSKVVTAGTATSNFTNIGTTDFASWTAM